MAASSSRKRRLHIGARVDSRVEIAAALHPWVELALANGRAKLRAHGFRAPSARDPVGRTVGQLRGRRGAIRRIARVDTGHLEARRECTGTPAAGGDHARCSPACSPARRRAADVPAILEGWGVELAEEEGVEDFLIAESTARPASSRSRPSASSSPRTPAGASASSRSTCCRPRATSSSSGAAGSPSSASAGTDPRASSACWSGMPSRAWRQHLTAHRAAG